jgi:hypothetical protein
MGIFINDPLNCWVFVFRYLALCSLARKKGPIFAVLDKKPNN